MKVSRMKEKGRKKSQWVQVKEKKNDIKLNYIQISNQQELVPY